MAYDIIQIPPDAREDTEQLGSKPKFWVLLDGQRWLFKVARDNTGEDWAEKAAAELAQALGIPAARVELARYNELRGCLSLNFVDVQAGEALVHGNEILAWHLTGYDRRKTFRQSDHTLDNLQAAIRALFLRDGPATGILIQLASYLVLDALIGNTDRHHENWGLLVRAEASEPSLTISVAPSFDHASSLGRELLDARRESLENQGGVARYIQKGRGGIFRTPDQPHGENPLRLVQVASRAYPEYFRPALERVARLDPARIRHIFDSLPAERASPVARQFAQSMVLSAQTSLIELLR